MRPICLFAAVPARACAAGGRQHLPLRENPAKVLVRPELPFAGFGRNLSLAKDYDTLAAFITLAFIQIAVGRLARP